MDLSVEEYIDGLLNKDALELPSDTVKPEELSLELPKWFDEEKYNRGRRFYWDFSYGFFVSMLLGVLPLLAIPSILRVLISTHRSTTTYTAYKRYVATGLHLLSWFEHDLKPGSISWKSLHMVRSQHARASLAGKLKGLGMVSQRDLALTQFGFIGYSILKPDKFGIRPLRKDDWDAYNHFWRVIGHMIGIEDRFNVCRKSVHETRQVCQILHERVISPSSANVPEYFEHMARVYLNGMKTVLPGVDTHGTIYFYRYISDVPGYIYTEAERIELRKQLKIKLKGKSINEGVEVSSLVSKPVDDLPTNRNLLYLDDYETFENNPVYKQLPTSSKIRLNVNILILSLNSIYLMRIFLNVVFKLIVYTLKYFPFGAFMTFGFKASFVSPFKETPVDYTKPKSNDKYYEEDKMNYHPS